LLYMGKIDMVEKKIIEEVIQISTEVGHFALSEFNSFDQSKVEYKGLNDLVSYVDKESERMLVERLKSVLPGSGFIAEEGTENRRDTEYTWVIDPLDGTTNYVHGIPIFAVSVGLLKANPGGSGNQIILGVIFDPSRDECFHATSTGPAFCNHREIEVSPNASLGQSLVATGFPFTKFDELSKYMPLLQEFMSKTHGVRRMGSAAIDLAYVACGKFDGFFEYNLNPWDVAAGALIVQRAGGKVTDFNGGDNYLFGRQILAANQTHQEMQQLINVYF